MEKERYERRKNIFVKKGKNWSAEVKLADWITENARICGVEWKNTVVAEGEAKVVSFVKKKTKDEFWFRKEEIRREGQYEIDEDLTFQDRSIRHELVRWGRNLRASGVQCRVENLYVAVTEASGVNYYAWYKKTGVYSIPERCEEKRWWKWKEEKERGNKERRRPRTRRGDVNKDQSGGYEEKKGKNFK